MTKIDAEREACEMALRKKFNVPHSGFGIKESYRKGFEDGFQAALAAANALPVQPKVTRDELLKDLKAIWGIGESTSQAVADYIIAKWPHLVGE